MINNQLFTRNNRLFLSAAENSFKSEILTCYTASDKDIKNQLILPLFVFTNRLSACIKTDLGEIIKIKDT